MRRVHRHPLASLVGVLLVAAVACWGPEPFRFHVTFEEVDDLEPGAPVLHRGLVVGEVTDVGLDEHGLVLVTVELEDEYRTAVASNSVIRVEATGLRRRRQLVIEEGPGPRQPLEPGDVLSGSEGVVDDAVTRLGEAARGAWESAADAAGDLADRIRTWAESDEARELADSLDALRREAVEQGREGWTRLREEEIPELREKAAELRRTLAEREGPAEAERFWSQFESELDKLRQAAEGEPESNPPAERPPNP